MYTYSYLLFYYTRNVIIAMYIIYFNVKCKWVDDYTMNWWTLKKFCHLESRTQQILTGPKSNLTGYLFNVRPSINIT